MGAVLEEKRKEKIKEEGEEEERRLKQEKRKEREKRRLQEEKEKKFKNECEKLIALCVEIDDDVLSYLVKNKSSKINAIIVKLHDNNSRQHINELFPLCDPSEVKTMNG